MYCFVLDASEFASATLGYALGVSRFRLSRQYAVARTRQYSPLQRAGQCGRTSACVLLLGHMRYLGLRIYDQPLDIRDHRSRAKMSIAPGGQQTMCSCRSYILRSIACDFGILFAVLSSSDCSRRDVAVAGDYRDAENEYTNILDRRVSATDPNMSLLRYFS